ncbi:acetyl-CoA carboxylase biotin carboxyl carrier protein [Bacteroidota bacterium]
MKKFKFSIRGNDYDTEILNIEDNIAEIEVNGTTYHVEIQKEMVQTKTPQLIRPKVVPKHEADKAKTHKPDAKKGAGQIKAPLPGTILELKKKEGDEVHAGDVILIMEAMKMENEIKADLSGKIHDIKVANGDSVLEGDVLFEIGE